MTMRGLQPDVVERLMKRGDKLGLMDGRVRIFRGAFILEQGW